MDDSGVTQTGLTADGRDPAYLRFYWKVGLFLCLSYLYCSACEHLAARLGLTSVRIFSTEDSLSPNPTFLGGLVGIGGCLLFVLPIVALFSETPLARRAMRLVCPALVVDARFGGQLAVLVFCVLTVGYVFLTPISLLLAVPVLLVERILGGDGT